MIVLDWEQGENAAWGSLGYLEQCIARVKERTGVPPVVYASASVFPWDLSGTQLRRVGGPIREQQRHGLPGCPVE